MIHNLVASAQTNSGLKGNSYVNSLFPTLETSFHRLTQTFFNRCSSHIDLYANCIGVSDWKNDVSQFVSDEKRKECHRAWSQVQRCSNSIAGREFTLKLDLSRQITDANPEDVEANSIRSYNEVLQNKLKFLKEDSPIEGESESEE